MEEERATAVFSENRIATKLQDHPPFKRFKGYTSLYRHNKLI